LSALIERKLLNTLSTDITKEKNMAMAEAMQRITNTVIIEAMINLWNHLPAAPHTKYVHSNNPHEQRKPPTQTINGATD